MRRTLILLVSLLTASLCSAVNAQDTVDATDAQRLVQIIRDLGYRAIAKTDGIGDPMIETSVNGTDTAIFFYGCRDNANCTTLLFKVGYDLEDGTTLEKVNAWNSENLYGRAYLDDEQDPWLEMTVNMLDGVTRKNFEDTFDWWDVAVGEFEQHIDF